MIISSWISPKTAKGKPGSVAGRGFFAIADIKKGEITAVKGGHIIDKQTYEANKEIIRDAEAVIADGLYIAPLSEEEFEPSMVFYNHSCQPNSGFGGNVILVALRDIKAGEELTVDYAMHRAEPKYVLTCNCQKPNCRKTVTGDDWKNPELQAKYAGHFSWYIEQKIKQLNDRSA